VDLGRANHGAVAGRIRVTAVDTGAGGVDAGAQLAEGPRIDQDVDPFPGSHLAAVVLAVDVLLPTAQLVLGLNLAIPLDGFFHSLTHLCLLPHTARPA
jgi:hypothetical protein